MKTVRFQPEAIVQEVESWKDQTDLWWTSTDVQTFRQFSTYLADTNEGYSYLQFYEMAYKSCQHYPADRQQQPPSPVHPIRGLVRALERGLQGLERTCSEFQRDNRRDHRDGVRAIVECYNNYHTIRHAHTNQGEGNDNDDDDDKEVDAAATRLREQCLQHTAHCQRWAAVLGRAAELAIADDEFY
jgi:hypothetical protein